MGNERINNRFCGIVSTLYDGLKPTFFGKEFHFLACDHNDFIVTCVEFFLFDACE